LLAEFLPPYVPGIDAAGTVEAVGDATASPAVTA
jgi:NADPH:quinone reductase-like Zn-dependent oxidoreductase